MRIVIWFILIFMLQIGCAPKVQQPDFSRPKFDFGPQKTDIDIIQLSKNVVPKNFTKKVFWDEVVNSSVVYRQGENFVLLGDLLQEPSLRASGQAWLESIEADPEFMQTISFVEAPYLKMATFFTKESSLLEVSKALPELQKSGPAIAKLVAAAKRAHPVRQGELTIEDTFKELKLVFQAFRNELEKAKLFEPVSSAFKDVLKRYDQKIAEDYEEFLPKLRTAKDLSEILDLVNKIVVRYDIKLDNDTLQVLDRANTLSASIKQCSSEATALRSVVDVWKLLDRSERKNIFKPISSELYLYLSVQSNSGLDCLRQTNCSGLIRDKIKEVFIYPKIKEYGVARICEEIKSESVKTGKQKIALFSQKALLGIHEFVLGYAITKINEAVASLKSLENDYWNFLKKESAVWANKTLPSFGGTVRGLPSAALKIKLTEKSIETAVSSQIDVISSEAIGSSLAFNKLILESSGAKTETEIRRSIEQLQRLLALGGYRNENGDLSESLFRPIGENDEKLDLMRIQELKGSFASGDRVKVVNGFDFDPKNEALKLDISAKNQAELLRGISKMIEHLRDWVPTSYDKQLGSIEARDVITSLNFDALARSFFPKEEMLALAVGNAAVILQNITKDLSPIFLVDVSGQVTWANEFDFESESTAIMAGVVDIKDGKRDEIVRSENVARYLIALATFLNATEGIERTKSKNLLKYDFYGKRSLDAIVAGRREVRLLVVALANMLSYQMSIDGGLIHNSLRVKDLKPVNSSNISVLDQALSIRGLLAASEVTPVKIYRWSAMDIYFDMNQRLFSPEMRFYKSPKYDGVYFPILLDTLRALGELRPYLDENSKSRLDWLLNYWKNELTQIRFNQ